LLFINFAITGNMLILSAMVKRAKGNWNTLLAKYKYDILELAKKKLA
jgi:hypothetical protein